MEPNESYFIAQNVNLDSTRWAKTARNVPLDHYKPTTGPENCKPCPGGQLTDQTGSTSLSNCCMLHFLFCFSSSRFISLQLEIYFHSVCRKHIYTNFMHETNPQEYRRINNIYVRVKLNVFLSLSLSVLRLLSITLTPSGESVPSLSTNEVLFQ